MDVAEVIYQHVKTMPSDKALEVLRFITFIETDVPRTQQDDVLEFIKKLPVSKGRTDQEIHQAFQTLRDEWT